MTLLAGVTWPRYFQVIAWPVAMGSKPLAGLTHAAVDHGELKKLDHRFDAQ